MNAYSFHISLYDLFFLGTIFIGLTFTLLLWFARNINKVANRFFALALAVMVLWMVRMLAIDVRLPLQFSLALGPLIYFYVLKLTCPQYKFSRKDLPHFLPVLLEQVILPNALLQPLTFISVIIYLYCSHRLVGRFYKRLKFIGGDRYRNELRWLHRLLVAFGLLWFLWIAVTTIDCYDHLGVQAYYPFYLLLMSMMIGIAASAHLRQEARVPPAAVPVIKPAPPAELKQKGSWLKNTTKVNLYYLDPDLSLGSLADKLGLTTHELSRIINTVLKKSFNDFINEYRVIEVKRKMQDPAYSHMNLMGIAYESGFNSKTTFNRAFKQVTGKNPVDYKNVGKKEAPSYNSGLPVRFAGLISFHGTTPDWFPEKLNRNFMFRNYLKLAWRNLSAKIRDIKLNNLSAGDRKFKPAIFLQPMSKWHLYAEFKNGVNTGGAIQYVLLFGIIGIFVLLLACINFMNLSTARSEKRAKEVGIRKAIGSLKSQLVKQFYCESFLVALLSFAVSLTLVSLALPWFNQVSGKKLNIPWDNPMFGLVSLGFTCFTGMIAGSYPALYLSSFTPVKVLKGAFKAGPFAALPRKVLVVTQFAVSIILMIGTIVVFKQVQYTKGRPTGYDRRGLINIALTNNDLYKQFKAVKADLLASGAVTAVAGSTSTTTGLSNNRGDIDWTGRDASQADFFGSIRVTPEYGRTVGWQFTGGRDFAVGNIADSLSVVLNEAAVKYMGFKHPVGQRIKVGGKYLTVIGVVKNMVMESPYEPAKQSIYYLGPRAFDYLLVRINPIVSAHEALTKIAAVSKAYSPSVPFSYHFVDDEYAKKFTTEERIGKLASAFAVLAIFISCLGLFGMASFTVEQRTKELGVRKILGASTFGLWRLISKDFVVLIAIALQIAIPVAYSFMQSWLQHYTYHTALSWWIFAATAIGAVFITLVTVSYQSIKAALTNPVNSLRSE